MEIRKEQLFMLIGVSGKGMIQVRVLSIKGTVLGRITELSLKPPGVSVLWNILVHKSEPVSLSPLLTLSVD